MAMENEQDNFDDRLEQVSRQWRHQRYTGPAPVFEPAPQRHIPIWAGALAAAAILIVVIWPSQPEWPDKLRPVVRGSPFQATAPMPPPSNVAFRLPGRPDWGSCFAETPSQIKPCDPPAG